jgi:hypothetical protein
VSYYRSETLLREWAESTLHRYLDPREYPLVFGSLRSPKKSNRLTRVDIGLLKIMLDNFRPERSTIEQVRYAESNAVRLSEIADTLHCAVTTVQRSKKRINKLVKDGARIGTDARKNGLLLFHDMGICIRATFWDAIRARAYSELMGVSSLDAHVTNIALSDEKKHGIKITEELVTQFRSLSPAEHPVEAVAFYREPDDSLYVFFSPVASLN